MKSGIYYDIAEAEYHALELCSSSYMSKLLKSPAHLRWALDNPDTKRRDAFVMGSAIHSILLEPDLFSQWCRGPEGDRRSAAVKKELAELREEYKDDHILRPEQYDGCLAIRDAVMAHETAKRLLGAEGDSEVTLIWQDEEFPDVTCKARVDRLPIDVGLGVVDLKSTKSAKKRDFEKSLWAYGYFRQASHYLEGLRILGERRLDFRFIAVEKEPPFGINVFRLDEGSIDAGALQIRRLIRTYQSCMESGVWPAYPDEEQDCGIPPWAFSDIDKG